MALDVMRHRLVLSYEALSDNITSDDMLNKILDRIPIPVVPLHEHCQRPRRTPETILQRLDWQVIRRLDGYLQGDYRSCSTATAWTLPTCANTSPKTTSATSTGMSPRG